MRKEPNPRTPNHLKVKKLPATLAVKPRTLPGQIELFIEKQREVNGVGMGVLSDGTAFLTGRGLAGLCGIDSSRISELAQGWDSENSNLMTKAVRKILSDKGVEIQKPYIEIKLPGEAFHAYSDSVCLAVLEYYAFDKPTEIAQRNFRLLAGRALHDFIYAQVGYDPSNRVPEIWRQFHDRVSLVYNAVPAGFYGVFKEISDLIVHLGQAGFPIDSGFVPDISIGLTWGKHWIKNSFDQKYGPRVKFEHNYPSYFPQADSNPQDAWCYPEVSLGEFRKWLRETYVGQGKFEAYLSSKGNQRGLPASVTQIVVAEFTGRIAGKSLPPPPSR